VAADLLRGLADLGHRIDCFFPSSGHPLPADLAEHENLTFVWGTSTWKWNRWYSRSRLGAFASGLLARGRASIRLRGEIARRHVEEPYDLIYQFSSIETPAVPVRLRRSLPLVIHPETHIAGELRRLIAERRLALRCQPAYVVALVATIMSVRALAQRRAIRRGRLLICISAVFRDHLVHDYGFPLANTVVIPNPVRIGRFTEAAGPLGEPPRILVLGRISVRKGIDDVVAVARALLERDVDVRIRVLGNPSLWSDYTKLLEDLPAENGEYAGHIPAAEIPGELARSDILLQASTYEPFGLTVAEALAAGVPVVATSEVGAAEGVDRSVLTEVRPGDVPAMANAITAMIERLRRSSSDTRSMAQSEARRLFASERVCEQVSDALEALLEGTGRPG
jgi:glycosyltransferase involved in cell wall biosynthesis